MFNCVDCISEDVPNISKLPSNDKVFTPPLVVVMLKLDVFDEIDSKPYHENRGKILYRIVCMLRLI